MRTEIPPANEAPAMTAEHMRRLIVSAYEAYETGDRAAIEDAIGPDFSFTSPYDDAIGREAYFERCWPVHEATESMQVERVMIEGDAAYVTYVTTNTAGQAFRNTEYLTFSGGKIASVEVYFGPEYSGGEMVPSQPQDTKH
jgi:ketosteroid isomerase-like protein